jgi:tRNA(fMet)-specific endonuclease VapC
VKVALDTNTYTDAARGEPRAVEVIRGADRVCLPFVVVGELRAGFSVGRRGKKNEGMLTTFLNSPRVSLIFPDDQTTHHYAALFAYLKRKGTPIPTNDLWIAALVVQNDLLLFSRDAHFERLPQLGRVEIT